MVASNRNEPPKRDILGVVLTTIAVAAVLVALVMLLFNAPRADRGKDAADDDEDQPSPPLPRRCGEPGKTLRVGEVGEGAEPAEGDVLVAAPFAAEVGRASALGDGFVVGLKRHLDTGTIVEVLLLAGDGSKREQISLGPLHGEGDPPLVVRSGNDWVAGVIEPNASGYALRLVHRRAGVLEWAAEIDQGRDESLAYDVALGEKLGVAVWDDLSNKRDRSLVRLVTLSLDDIQVTGKSRVVSRRAVEADLPRLVLRQGGFWLAYLAREPVGEPADGAGGEGRYAAQSIVPSWVEVLPLDELGAPAGEPIAVTPRDGYALTYDLGGRADSGDALVAWRDDDTPSGSHGGRVLLARVGSSGSVEVEEVTAEGVGAGVPRLSGAWMAVPNTRGTAQLAPLNNSGQLVGPLIEEPSLGVAQLLSEKDGKLLISSPYGRAMDLAVVACDPQIFDTDESAAVAAAAAAASAAKAAVMNHSN